MKIIELFKRNIHWLIFAVAVVATITLIFQTSTNSKLLDDYTRMDFRSRMVVRAIAQVRLHLNTVAFLTDQIFLDEKENADHYYELIIMQLDSSLSQVTNAFDKKDTAVAERMIESLYLEIDSLRVWKSAESHQERLMKFAQSARDTESHFARLESNAVARTARQYSEMSYRLMSHNRHFYALSAIILVSFLYIIILLFQKASAYQKLLETRRQLDEEQMNRFHLAKLSLLGEMAAGVAHEINNPLTIIMGHVNKIRRLSEQAENVFELNQASDRVEKTVMRISKIVRGMLDFARDGGSDPFSPVPLEKVMTDSLMLSQARVNKKQIQLRLKPVPEDILISCRPWQVCQIVMNLLSNAVDEIEKQESPWIEISFERFDDRVRILITDSGRGIPVEIREKIFNPFFTNKEVGKGVGLGLSISKGIAESHGARIYLNDQHENTQFVIEFPIYQSGEEALMVLENYKSLGLGSKRNETSLKMA